VLQDAGIKLATVATNILGVSGRAMLEALVGGTTAPEVLAELARGTSARSCWRCGRRWPGGSVLIAFLVSQGLAHLDYLDEAIDTVSTEVERLLLPFAEPRRRLDTIPGINTWTAEVVITEIGVDMSRFPSEHHLANWAGLCPGGATRKGNRWLRMALIEVALAAIREVRFIEARAA
jgi:transposase